MRTKITFKLSEEESAEVSRMAKIVGVDMHTFSKKAVFYAINDSYRRAHELQEQQRSFSTEHTGESDGQSTPTVTESDSPDELGGQVPTGDALPNSEDAGTSSP